MPPPARIEEPIQLLVEGKDQLNFFEVLLRDLSLKNEIQIQDFGGVTELGSFLVALVDSPNFETVVSIGVARDAENSAVAARQSVEGSLQRAGLPAPADAGEGRAPSVHVLILPDDEEPGMIETLLYRSVADTPVNSCIDEFFHCVGALPGIDIRNPDKARAQAYLATRPMPAVSVGVAAQKGYWPLDHAAFAGVRTFLTALQGAAGAGGAGAAC